MVDIKLSDGGEKKRQAAQQLKTEGRSCSSCRVSFLLLPSSQLAGFQSSFNTHPEGERTVCPRTKAQLKTHWRKGKKKNKKKHTAYPPCVLSPSSHQQTALVYFSAKHTAQQIVPIDSRGDWAAQPQKTEWGNKMTDDKPLQCERHCRCPSWNVPRRRLTFW